VKIVEVYWVDAWIDTGDVSLSKAKKAKPIERYTVGYLIEETDESIILSTDYFPKKGRTKEVSALMVIPMGWIKSWEIQEIENGGD
jgi:hypothetical protein